MTSLTLFRAEKAGITIFQEIGLDPGIDHLLAMNCFDSVTEAGGKVSVRPASPFERAKKYLCFFFRLFYENSMNNKVAFFVCWK